MTQYHPICYQIKPLRTTQENINQSDTRKRLLDTQDSLIKTICGLGNNLTLSLRYYYHPQHSPKLKTYLLIKSSRECQTTGVYGQIANQLTKGSISNYFQFTHEPNFSQAQNLSWVKVIGEIIKYEQLIPTKNYYLPHLLDPNPANDMLVVYEVINKLDHQLILEITIQTYQNDQEKSTWLNAINQMVEQLNQVNDKDATALNLYRQYQQQFSQSILAKYSIKALAENIHDEKLILDTLGDISTKKDNYQRQYQIVSIHQGESAFTDSLTATENVDISTVIEWEGWRNYQDLWMQPIKDVIKPKNKPKSNDPLANLAGLFDDGSLTLPSITPSSSAIVANSGSLLAKLATANNSVNVVRLIDLKPLHRLVTLQEISGFFRIAIPKGDPRKMNFITMSAEELFSNYQHLISQDTYIVGIDDERNPIISSWAEIPHRLVAGVPGSGKTNFLNWVVFQFLYATKNQGKIYIADFAGADFNFLEKIGANVQIVKTVKECENLIETIHTQEYENRLTLMQNHGVQNLKQLQREGINIERTLWIIDEAADIANASWELKETIEKRLKDYARKGRKFGIHIIYCTQRPTGEIISGQVTDQCEEKIVFRVSLEASQLILDNNSMASNIPKTACGRAVLRGSDADNIFVNTPFIPVPVGTQVKLTDTLWYNIPNLINN